MTRGPAAEIAPRRSRGPFRAARAAARHPGAAPSRPMPGTRPWRPYACAPWRRSSSPAPRRRSAKPAKIASPWSATKTLTRRWFLRFAPPRPVFPHRNGYGHPAKVCTRARSRCASRNARPEASPASPKASFSRVLGASPSTPGVLYRATRPESTRLRAAPPRTDQLERPGRVRGSRVHVVAPRARSSSACLGGQNPAPASGILDAARRCYLVLGFLRLTTAPATAPCSVGVVRSEKFVSPRPATRNQSFLSCKAAGVRRG